MVERLRLMGWLMYETTWTALQQMPHRFRQEGGEAGRKAQERYDVIVRVTNAARRLPWPEYAVLALGAYRALALAESKHDNEEAFLKAQSMLDEAREAHADFQTYHLGRNLDELHRDLRALDEIFLQLALAETGTACRTAEMVIDRWLEEFAPKGADADDYLLKLYRQIVKGIEVGEQALEVADRVKERHGFVDEVSEEGIALPTSFINPGVMTARAILLLLALSPEMERLGLFPLGNDNSWDESRRNLVKRFDDAYAYIERPIEKSSGERVELRPDLQIAVVQMRTAAGLLIPGHELPSTLGFAPCLSHRVLDDAAVEEMSTWMTETITDSHGRTTQRTTFRGFGGSSMPNFIEGAETCRDAFGGAPGFKAWRARWFVLDKLAGEPGRAAAVSQILGLPVETERPYRR
jgi:hypothetical protein